MQLPKNNIEARRIIKKASIQIIGQLLRYYQEQGGEIHRNRIYWDCDRLLRIARCSPDTPDYQKYYSYLPTTVPHDVYEEAFKKIKDKSLDTAIDMALKHWEI